MLKLQLISTICCSLFFLILVDSRRLSKMYEPNSPLELYQNKVFRRNSKQHPKPYLKYSDLPQHHTYSNRKHYKSNLNRVKTKLEDSKLGSKFQIKPELEGRIIGGVWVQPEKVPYQLHFDDKGDVECGATLVEVYGIQVAITATHCLWTGYPDSNSTKKAEDLVVVAGDYNLKDRDYDKEQRRHVTKVAIYPGYDPRYLNHDIAILFIKTEFQYTKYVQAAILPEFNWDQPENVKISGWGSATFGEDLQNFLHYVELPVVKFKVCHDFNKLKYLEITDHMFCVGAYGGPPKGSCSGDSGGPAIGLNKTSNKPYLAGVVSFGITTICGNPYAPTVFTKVSKYVDWIRIEVSDYIQANGLGRK